MKKLIYTLGVSVLSINIMATELMTAKEALNATNLTTKKIHDSLMNSEKGKKSWSKSISIIKKEIEKRTSKSTEKYVSLNASMFKSATKGLNDEEEKILEKKVKEELLSKGFRLVDGKYSMIPFNFHVTWN